MRMDSKHIEALLEKYWDAETTLEQEQELREFFQGNKVPENLNEAATLQAARERRTMTWVFIGAGLMVLILAVGVILSLIPR